MRSRRLTFVIIAALTITNASADPAWNPNVDEKTYKNPVIHADYSDPDVIRVGDDFYMVASSMNSVPGIPVLHSKDLVNWELINHVLDVLPPKRHYSIPRHGSGAWAPTIRHHKGEFYMYYGDPDFGIFLSKAKDPAGEWSPLTHVKSVEGWIDPCPFWDDDGKAYMALAFSAGRIGIRTVLAIVPISEDGTEILGDPVIVFDGHDKHPTIEGPKLHKRDGYYYIFAPAGGVTPGWQTVLRSRNIYGPYEIKTTMAQGDTDINGPHQGAWVELESGEDWFVHFQDKKPYGRVVHLQPMTWQDNGFPVMGVDPDGDGVGSPVETFRKPGVGGPHPEKFPATSDEFDGTSLGLQWQWQANEGNMWKAMFPAESSLRLYPVITTDTVNLWERGNILLQKFPAPEFQATAKLDFQAHRDSESAGLVVMGRDYAALSLSRTGDRLQLRQNICRAAHRGNQEETVESVVLPQTPVYLRVTVENGGLCKFAYSTDGTSYETLGNPFQAVGGTWIGAKVGLFCNGSEQFIDIGYTDVDWFRIEPPG